MKYKRGTPTPEYMRALNDFITEFWKRVPRIGKHYQEFKFINDKNEAYSKEPAGADKNQYSKYVNGSGEFKFDSVKKILERLEFL